MAVALVISLAAHSLLFSLIFGDQERGLPGLAILWRERRIEAPDIRVVLVPALVKPAEPAAKSDAGPGQPLSIEPPAAVKPASPVPPAPPPRRPAVANVPA
ncbi:MAG TPA: hypothetical protein VFK10_08820, partial [Burkholderiaceae bacterium]|nr:hypothetical protein [Burkholderiaceae bacterium]